MTRIMQIVFIAASLLTLSLHAFAAHSGTANCTAHHEPLAINNAQVLDWKQSTENQYSDFGHIQGTITQILSGSQQQIESHSSHHSHGVDTHTHFLVQIGPKPSDQIEVIYNDSFGQLPPLKPGEPVEACGVYITSNAPSGPYKASPAGAILHWVHYAPGHSQHDSGFVAVDGQIYGGL